MRLFRGPAQSGEKTDSINLAVKVVAYVEEKGMVSVKGTRLDTGEEVYVTLTNRGDLASNIKRPALAHFRDKKNNLGVEVGGVIGFDRCYPNGAEGKYYAGWPIWFAGSGSEEDMKRVKVNRPTTLQIRSSNTSARLFGTLSVWQPDNITEFAPRKEESGAAKAQERLEAATAKWLNDVAKSIPSAHGAAIMRARNAASEVVAYTYLYARWDKERGGYEDGDTTLTNFKASRSYEGFTQEAKVNGATKFDIVPAVNLDVSPKALEDAGNALKATEKAFRRDGELIAKGTTFVLDPNHRFVTKVMVHDPYGESGIDPVLLAKGGTALTYNAAFKASMTGPEAAATGPGNETRTAEPSAPAPSIAV